MYLRVSYEYYVEGDYENEEEAIDVFMESIDEMDKDELTVEVFNDETNEWELK